jgi:hypothetical protein
MTATASERIAPRLLTLRKGTTANHQGHQEHQEDKERKDFTAKNAKNAKRIKKVSMPARRD